MYIIVFEDGTIRSSATVEDDVLEAASDSFCDVLDVSGEVPLIYSSSEWKEVEPVES